MRRTDSLEETLMLEKIEGRWKKGTTDGWMALPTDGHEFEQALGVGDGQGNLLFCSPWGCKELDMTE